MNKNGTKEIIGTPKGVRCKCDYMESTDTMITKSALVYTRIDVFLPWIHNVFNSCGTNTYHFENIPDTLVFSVTNQNVSKKNNSGSEGFAKPIRISQTYVKENIVLSYNGTIHGTIEEIFKFYCLRTITIGY